MNPELLQLHLSRGGQFHQLPTIHQPRMHLLGRGVLAVLPSLRLPSSRGRCPHKPRGGGREQSHQGKESTREHLVLPAQVNDALKRTERLQVQRSQLIHRRESRLAGNMGWHIPNLSSQVQGPRQNQGREFPLQTFATWTLMHREHPAAKES